MSEFLGLLNHYREKKQALVACINGKEVIVKVVDVRGDWVTLEEQERQGRYDLCYTQVVIHSSMQPLPQ